MYLAGELLRVVDQTNPGSQSHPAPVPMHNPEAPAGAPDPEPQVLVVHLEEERHSDRTAWCGARICGKSRSFVRIAYWCSRANAQISVSGAVGSPASDQWSAS